MKRFILCSLPGLCLGAILLATRLPDKAECIADIVLFIAFAIATPFALHTDKPA